MRVRCVGVGLGIGLWGGLGIGGAGGCGGDLEGKEEPACVDEVPYDGVDNDCAGGDLTDLDDDGFDSVLVEGGEDCDDGDPAVNPDAEEVPYDGVDNDCAGGDLTDVDGDGVDGGPGGLDCDDDDPDIVPGGIDAVGDGVDNNCDGVDGVDRDADGYASRLSGGTDCDDDDPARNPAADEIWYDGVDQNCDGACDYDADGDGAVLPGSPVPDGSPCDLDPGPEGAAPADCDDEDPAIGEHQVVFSLPHADRSAANVLAQPTFVLSGGSDGSAVATLEETATGDAVAGTSTVDGALVTFTPDDILQPATDYTAALTYGCGTASFGFETLPDAPPIDEGTLAGRRWILDLSAGSWIEPGGSDILAYVIVDDLYLEVLAADGDSLDLRLATGTDGAQNLCVATADPVAAFANPDLSFAVDAIPLALVDASAPTIVGRAEVRVGADGQVVGALEGHVDTADLAGVFGLGREPDAVCGLFATFGVDCVPCAEGEVPTCMPFVVEAIPGTEGAPALVARDQAAIDADPGCD